jgi:ATP-dependent DNA helicase RecQ
MLKLIKVDHERFNTLRLTEGSREVLRGERQLRLRRQADRAVVKRAERRPIDGSRIGRTATTVEAENDDVFQALRGWRKDVAKEHGVPAYTVFHDSTLHELADRLPRSPQELRSISGIGATKFERYGAAILDLIQRTAP